MELGQHYLIDLHGCDPTVIDDTDQVREILLAAARESGATLVTDVFHKFSPQGVSGVVVIAESHMAIHSWPEFGCVAVDIFSCSSKLDVEIATEIIKNGFRASSVEVKQVARGRK